jgi:CBS domain-containing membrane protein
MTTWQKTGKTLSAGRFEHRMTPEQPPASASALKRYLNTVFPPQPYTSSREVFLSAVGALAAILILAVVSTYFAGTGSAVFVVASMGASAVLLFATPHSPLAQPWSFAGAHLIAATVGVACQRYIPNNYAAIAIAVAVVILLMHYLRCLHPPAGGTVLLPLLGSSEVQQLGYPFVVAPVGLNVVLLLLLALAINRFIPGRRYPLPHHEGGRVAGPQPPGWPLGRLGLTPADLERAIKEMNAYIDVSEEDLEEIYARAELHAHQRRMGNILCRDVMTRDVVTVEFGDELEAAWELMRARKLKGLPVVDRARRVVGIVTIIDFLKRADTRAGGHLFVRLVRFIRRTPGLSSDKPEVVGQIMTAPAVTVPETAHIISLIPMFAEHGIHHVPVVNAQGKLAGMITQSDLTEALYRYRTALK